MKSRISCSWSMAQGSGLRAHGGLGLTADPGPPTLPDSERSESHARRRSAASPLPDSERSEPYARRRSAASPMPDDRAQRVPLPDSERSESPAKRSPPI